jgi:hypothetical protein
VQRFIAVPLSFERPKQWFYAAGCQFIVKAPYRSSRQGDFLDSSFRDGRSGIAKVGCILGNSFHGPGRMAETRPPGVSPFTSNAPLSF